MQKKYSLMANMSEMGGGDNVLNVSPSIQWSLVRHFGQILVNKQNLQHENTLLVMFGCLSTCLIYKQIRFVCILS